MRDLAIIVPSRGRPSSVARLADACKRTCLTDYQLCWGFDDDDPHLDENKRNAASGYIWTGPRDGLTGWTNKIWRELEGEFRYFASIGDDHIPQTHGWDKQLTTVLEMKGGGFSYCWNGHEQDIPNFPEMCVISAPILSALGWMAEPSMHHFCIDVVWMDLGHAAGCLYYLPEVTLYHDHHNWTAPRDSTYWDAIVAGQVVDPAAHQKWRDERMESDVVKVRSALTPPAAADADAVRPVPDGDDSSGDSPPGEPESPDAPGAGASR